MGAPFLLAGCHYLGGSLSEILLTPMKVLNLFIDQLLEDCGGQPEVISMMQSWDRSAGPFSVMPMSTREPKEPRCHGLMLFGNLGVYQGIASFFGWLCWGN